LKIDTKIITEKLVKNFEILMEMPKNTILLLIAKIRAAIHVNCSGNLHYTGTFVLYSGIQTLALKTQEV
jgi:hydrogenase maturation factor HypF (carbamoyltransferase family)